MSTIELENRYTSGVYPKREVAIVRGEGALVWDEEGRWYIDCVGGHGVALVGHSNPAVAAAICRQASTLITCPEIFYSDVRAQFMQRLVELALVLPRPTNGETPPPQRDAGTSHPAAAGPGGLERVFLCNSGTEAVEAALKFARLSTGRPGVVATMRGFHGRTMGALSATWEPKYREPFEPLLPGFHHVPYNNLPALAEAVDETIGAVLLEVVQGEGGVNLGQPDYLLGARDLCVRRGALLIVDEVQTGLGRTGQLFACQHYGLEPDLLCLAKGIAGGVPMGAVLIGPRVGGFKPGVHGTTFGGNALACAAALATVQYIVDNDLPGQAAQKGAWALQRLSQIASPLVREVRGLGLIIGIELRQKVTPYLRLLMGEGVLALPAGQTVLRLLPPLVISEQELTMACAAIERVLTRHGD